MKNYRRLSGDGSVKVVLSGDPNSPPKTTSEREPPSYNSSPTQEVCPFIPVGDEVTSLTFRALETPPAPELCTFVALRSRCHTLPSLPTTDNGQRETDKLKNVDSALSQSPSPYSSVVDRVSMSLQKINFSSCPLCVLGGFVVKGSSHPKFQKKPVSSPKFTFAYRPQTPLASDSVVKFGRSQSVESFPLLPSVQVLSRSRTCRPNSLKKPVFAPIRALRSSHSAWPFPIRLQLFPATEHSQLTNLKNVDKHPFHPRGSAIIENYRLSLFRAKHAFKNIDPGCCGLIHPQAKTSKKPVFAPIRALRDSHFAPQKVDFPLYPIPALGLPAIRYFVLPPSVRLSLQKNNSTFRNSSHQNSQKRLEIPRIPPNPTSTSHQKADCFPWDLALGNSLVISAWTFVIRSSAALSLQKINFSVSATLKRPPLQMNDLRQFSAETNKIAETLKPLEHLINALEDLAHGNYSVIETLTILPTRRLYLQKSNSTFHGPQLPPRILHSQFCTLNFFTSHQNSQKTPDSFSRSERPNWATDSEDLGILWSLALGK